MSVWGRRVSAIAAAAAFLAPLAHGAQTGHDHSFHGAQQWAQVFDDPKRDAWQKPHEVIQALGLQPDAVVADVGAGTGYFTMRLAHMASRGTVYAVDAEPDMVAYLRRRAEQAGLANVRAVQASGDDPRLPEKADVILFVDVYHHIADRQRYFARLRNALKAVSPDAVKRELAGAGYALAAEHDFLPYQYYLVFRPQAQ
jgi:predicted methyltransferase